MCTGIFGNLPPLTSKDEPNTGLSSKSASDSSCDAFDAKKMRHGARRTDSRQQPKKCCIKYTSIKMCHTSTTTTPVYIIQYIIWPHRHEHARVHSRGDVEQHVVMLGEQGVFEVHAKVQDGQHSRQPRRVEDEAVRVERVQRYQSLTRQGQRARFVLFCFTQKSKSSVIYIYIYLPATSVGVAFLHSTWYPSIYFCVPQFVGSVVKYLCII